MEAIERLSVKVNALLKKYATLEAENERLRDAIHEARNQLVEIEGILAGILAQEDDSGEDEEE